MACDWSLVFGHVHLGGGLGSEVISADEWNIRM